MRVPLTRKISRVAALVAALLVAYLAGVVTGVGGTPSAAPSSALDQAEARIAADAAHPVSRAELERSAVEGMLAALDDRWAAYYGPADFHRFEGVLAGRYSGVGIWVRRAGGQLVVDSVQSGSPAADAGVEVGDLLVSVAGRSVAGRSVADVVAALRGNAGTTVTIVVSRGALVRTLTLGRVALSSDDVSVSWVGAGVEQIRVAAFTRGVGRRVREAVAAAGTHPLTGIVLDLRGNPGGLLSEAVETASVFLDGGPVVSYVHRGHAPDVLDALGSGDTTTPLVVLVDGGTASAAEIVAGALQDRGRAVLVGSRTFGKGSVQEPTQLSDGSAIELTVGRYLTPDGRSLDGVGLQPDVEVDAADVGDIAVQRALQVLSGMLADSGTAGRG